MSEFRPPLIVLTGPTACGKSEVGVCLARMLKTEIISADSVQVYKEFDIGSAKPTSGQLKQVRHHLVSALSPDEEYSVARFREEASEIARGLWSGKKIPLVVGGTGLYLKGLIGGFTGGVKITSEANRKLRGIYEKEGQAGAYSMAKEIDPHWMSKVHPNDTFRTTRALGVYFSSGKTLTRIFAKNKNDPEWDVLFFVLNLSREELYGRIEARVEKMLSAGLREEVKRLKGMGYNNETKPMRALGYKELYNETEGILSPDETVAVIKKNTKAFARRQLTWFRKVPGAIFIPIDSEMDADSVAEKIASLNETREFFRRHDIFIG